MCQGFNDSEYVNYIISSPASFGGGKKPEIVAKELFPEKFPENVSFTRKKLNNNERKEFERALESEATWRLDREVLAIFHMQCEKKTSNESSICNKCEQLKSNKRLNEALKAKRATNSTIKYIPRYYYNEPLLKLLKNSNLRQIWASMNNENDAEFWIKLAQFGLSGAFDGDNTFTELASLMVQIKEKKFQGKSLKGLRYSEHLVHFFSLLSESSREYEIFRKAFAGISI
ncbi:hypothetical protein C2G38_469931 [Gigaspora rosea]|uniref:Uncharacterized protein n=1 Tax=Gigaspora rosea TaxID=44941 RepID=A0A397VVX6_9GLOM|nr:hypothetical protein C2G38_469931 [Gigaspora rosea]